MKKTLITVTLVLLNAFVLYAEENPFGNNKVDFQVILSDLAVTISWEGKTSKALSNPLANGLAKGKLLSDELEVSYPGVLYAPPVQLSIVSKAAAKFTTPKDAAQAGFSAMKSQKDAWILECFDEADRQEIEGWLKDPELRKNLFEILKSAQELEVSGEIRYKGYAILFIRQLPPLAGAEQLGPFPFVFKETPQGWRQTNALSDDEILDILLPMLHNHKGSIKQIQS